MNDRPALAMVLSGGGAQASYQVGVLQAIAERFPDLRVPIITGVSAGAINASYLAGHRGNLREAVDGLRAQWNGITSDKVYGLRSAILVRSIGRWLERLALGGAGGTPGSGGLLDNRPLREFLAGCIDFDGIRANVASGRLRAVAITATSFATGYTVSFIEGGPDVAVWTRVQRIAAKTRLTLDHVMASSAIPIVFPAVEVDGAYYADGSVRQGAPLSAAVHLEADRILAIGTRPAIPPLPPAPARALQPTPVEALTLLLDTVFMDALDADSERLKRLNRTLALLPPGTVTPEKLRRVDIQVVRPAKSLGPIVARCIRSVDRLPRAMRLIVRGLGIGGEAGAGFLSYLLFEPAYTGLLIEQGYADGKAQMPAIEAFLNS